MSRCYNFSAGPAALPDAVLEKARDEMLDWRGTGMSVMEMSHRSKEFIEISDKAEADFRALLKVPKNYKVLFMQGGATAQTAMVPMNLLAAGRSADYIDSGAWAQKAIKEAQRLDANIRVAGSSEADDFLKMPSFDTWDCDANAAYLHYVSNETISGAAFHEIPEAGDVPLVCDMSSDILSRPIDVSKFGVIYGGAQKNIGPAGITLAVVRDDLLGISGHSMPSVMDYAVTAKSDSMYNTPPTYSWYLAGLVFEWALEQGGLDVISERNHRKAAKLYDYIDSSSFYSNKISPESRSIMNATFSLADDSLEGEFLAQAAENQLKNLKGHRMLGGMRASIYNAMTEAGVDALIAFMKEFERAKV
ncbi:3-phosphoserine/phosphohydroxythreonine transaminase [Leucothrix sargassi]|nr:3-phosphoserine/phosphohydroxythreonine transaminase [Leucothrix sargassi]